MAVIKTVNIVPTIINTFLPTFTDSSIQPKLKTHLTDTVMLPVILLTTMLVTVLVLHTVEVTYFYGFCNRWHGSNENTIHDFNKNGQFMGTSR
jgi:hypothetical protein